MYKYIHWLLIMHSTRADLTSKSLLYSEKKKHIDSLKRDFPVSFPFGIRFLSESDLKKILHNSKRFLHLRTRFYDNENLRVSVEKKKKME